ncbi:MAG: HAD-IIIA family hydrolase [Desulfatitalea sp.]|nr:HAD-IIIA family hydrolase [Desulfatitalea sp.]NNJ99421.1 HAD-IIIA family hydrolase [Desulfatitalea sp.]
MTIQDRLKRVRLMLLDVDGVLTAGEIIYGDSGEQYKVFNVKDGLGIRMLQQAGIRVGIVTGRSGKALMHRCRNLDIDLVFDGVKNKAMALVEARERTGIDPAATAFIGDDLPDLAIMCRVGLAVAVADAHEMVRAAAHLTTQAAGGRGAVREISEAILKARDQWTSLVEQMIHG